MSANSSSANKNGAATGEKNSLAAVLSKLQQIKTQGSLTVQSTAASSFPSENETCLSTSVLTTNPPSQKISSSAEKSLYKYTFPTATGEFNLFVNLPHSLNPMLLPDPPITNKSTQSRDKAVICRVCRMDFTRPEDRDKHLGRKSCRIICQCSDMCRNNKTPFFNKCTFYIHLVQEKTKSSTSTPFDLSKCNVSGLEPEDYPIVSQEWYHALNKGAPSTEALLREKIKCILEANEVATENLPTDFCPVCEVKVASVADHLQEFVPLEEQNCSLCARTSLINPCAFTAHQSLHNMSSKICPECGVYSERCEDFNKHLKQCHHFNKISGFRCINCQLNFTKISVMVDHVAKKHSEFFFKCSKCTLAFKSESSVMTHYASSHSTKVTSPFVKSLQQLYKCLICDQLTIGEDAIKEHVIAQHVNLSRVRRFFYFRCPSCAKVYESKAELVSHLATATDEKHVSWKANEAICDVCHETFPRYMEMVSHREANHASVLEKFTPAVPMQYDASTLHSDKTTPFKAKSTKSSAGLRPLVCSHPACAHSATHFFHASQLELHMSVNHSPRICKFCDSTFYGSSAFEKHLLIDHGKGNVADAFECIFCQTKFDNSVTRNHHVTLFHGWGKNVGGGVSNSPSMGAIGNATGISINKLECKVCSLTFDKSSTCRDHFALVHPSGFNFVCVNCQANSDGDSVVDSNGKRCPNLVFETLSDFKQHQSEKHGFSFPKPAKIGRFVTTGEGGDCMMPTSLFSCFKGDYSTNDRAEFVWHIQQHVDKTQPWQCGECGFNMIQEAGLKSHLATQHNITNYEEYKEVVMKRPFSADKSSSDKQQKPSLIAANPLVCSVCFCKFEHFVDYKSHRDSAHS